MIQFSPAAIAEIQRLQQRCPHENVYLRLRIESGGCMGLFYTLKFDPDRQADDAVIAGPPLPLLLDPATQQLVGELAIDYSEDLMGGGFRFDNPQAVQTCSCGNSFALAAATH